MIRRLQNRPDFPKFSKTFPMKWNECPFTAWIIAPLVFLLFMSLCRILPKSRVKQSFSSKTKHHLLSKKTRMEKNLLNQQIFHSFSICTSNGQSKSARGIIFFFWRHVEGQKCWLVLINISSIFLQNFSHFWRAAKELRGPRVTHGWFAQKEKLK
jgi:hypothetical protein